MGSIYATRQRTRTYRPPAVNAEKTKHPVRHEDNLQVRCGRYLKVHYPDVIFFCDSGAGQNMSNTQRIVMMQSRSDDGMCDLIIDEPVDHLMPNGTLQHFNGARFELKKEGTKIYKKDGVTLRKQPYTRKYRRNGKWFIHRGDHLEEQAAMIKKYRAKNYMACFVVGYEDFCHKVDRYLDRQQSLTF